MSPKKPPPTLHLLCLNTLSNQLILALSDEEGKYISELKTYMEGATSDTLQALLNGILELINLDASTRFSCLEVLLREDVKQLEVGIFPRFYYDKILDTITEQGRGLQQLNLKGVWVRDYPQLLSRLILELQHLKTLIIPHMADDSVISSVVSLKHLVKLDISGEACYTVEGIRFLKSESIRILDIGSFGKANLCQDAGSGYELVAEIITNLPSLNVLKTYSFTGHALLHLLKKDNRFRTKLTYIHSTDCTKEIIGAVIATSPLLENCHINRPQEEVIVRLSDIKKLHSLKLTKGDDRELTKFLQVSGNQLQALTLNHNKNTSLDLSQLCEYVPYISTLECFQMFLEYLSADAFFMNLQKVQFFYCDISDNVIKTILTNAPFLKSITVGCSMGMTDGDMFRLLSECSLANLEELIFSEARFLTAVTIQLLAENCVNLKVIGSVTSWDVTQDELDALRVIIALTNTDLTLWPVN